MKFLAVVIYCAVYASLNVTGAAIIKSELLGYRLAEAKDFIMFLLRFKVMVGFGIILVSALVLFKALSIAKFSLVSPISNGINFALTLFIGYFVFKDKIGVYHLLGLGLILTGILIIGIVEK